jgi:RimJ/RimL family protein N-acetyltransferase
MSERGDDPSAVTLTDGVILLRPWRRSDAGVLVEASTDQAVDRYNGPLPRSLARAEETSEAIVRNWRTFDASGDPTGAAFAIVDAAGGDVIGMCGVDAWSATDVAQFGYWLLPGSRGRGYATRAARSMTGWLFERGAARVFMTIVAGNEESAAVARRAGFTYEGTLRSFGVWNGQRADVDVFAVLPHEWDDD